MKIRVSKCYLVQVIDDEGNELNYDYVFCDNKKQAMEIGRQLKLEVMISRGVDNETKNN